jgi:hypothetical protein
VRTELNISDEDIREMLRPPTALERSAKAIPILRLLAKHGELPADVLRKIFRDRNLTMICHLLASEGYVTEQKAAHRGSVCYFFKITKRGRAALK